MRLYTLVYARNAFPWDRSWRRLVVYGGVAWGWRFVLRESPRIGGYGASPPSRIEMNGKRFRSAMTTLKHDSPISLLLYLSRRRRLRLSPPSPWYHYDNSAFPVSSAPPPPPVVTSTSHHCADPHPVRPHWINLSGNRFWLIITINIFIYILLYSTRP